MMKELNPRWTVEWLERNSCPDPNSGCILWCGELDRLGYGRVTVHHGRKRLRFGAHRVALGVALGRMPSRCVLHSCDTPACVNPRHLREGTMAENNADAISRGRHVVPHMLVLSRAAYAAVARKAACLGVTPSRLIEVTFSKDAT